MEPEGVYGGVKMVIGSLFTLTLSVSGRARGQSGQYAASTPR